MRLLGVGILALQKLLLKFVEIIIPWLEVIEAIRGLRCLGTAPAVVLAALLVLDIQGMYCLWGKGTLFEPSGKDLVCVLEAGLSGLHNGAAAQGCDW